MNSIKILVSHSLILFILWGCSGKEAEDMTHSDSHTHHEHRDIRTTEVLSIHDSVMLNMASLMQLSEALKSHIIMLDSISKTEKKESYQDDLSRANMLLTELDESGEEMMLWMRNFKPDTLEKLKEEAARHYIQKQKEDIIAVRDKIGLSISNTRKFLQK